MIRIYFNARNAPEGIWSVDEGDGTPERNFDHIEILGGHWATGGNPGATKDQPSAWIESFDTEFRDCSLPSEKIGVAYKDASK